MAPPTVVSFKTQWYTPLKYFRFRLKLKSMKLWSKNKKRNFEYFWQRLSVNVQCLHEVQSWSNQAPDLYYIFGQHTRIITFSELEWALKNILSSQLVIGIPFRALSLLSSFGSLYNIFRDLGIRMLWHLQLTKMKINFPLYNKVNTIWNTWHQFTAIKKWKKTNMNHKVHADI